MELIFPYKEAEKIPFKKDFLKRERPFSAAFDRVIMHVSAPSNTE